VIHEDDKKLLNRLWFAAGWFGGRHKTDTELTQVIRGYPLNDKELERIQFAAGYLVYSGRFKKLIRVDPPRESSKC
jgi:hypothetical protein